MKKKIISLLLCGVLVGTSLGLAACGNDDGKDGVTPTPPPVVTPDDPSKPIGPDKPIVPENPDTPATMPSVFDRAKTLAQNVDDLPDMSAVENIGGAKRAARRNNGGARADADREIVDLTTPPQDLITDYDSHYGQQISFVDSTIGDFKRTKDDALEVCRQLGVWVNSPRDFCDFKIEYDRASDTVTIEKRYDDGTQKIYYNVRCTYNYLGKMTVRGGYALMYENGNIMSLGVDYVEDESWTCAYSEPSEYGEFKHLIRADLSSEERAVSKQTIFESKTETAISYMNKTIITEYEGKPIVIDYNTDDASVYYSGFDVYGAAGELLIKNNRSKITGAHNLDMNLYMLDGWDKAFYYPDESYDALNHIIRMQIGEVEYSGADKHYFDDSQKSAWHMRGSSYNMLSVAKPLILCELYDGLAIDEFLAKWNLSVKDEYADTVDYLCFGGWDYNEFLSGWSAFGMSGYVFADNETMSDLYAEISAALGVYTLDKWNDECDGIFEPAAIAIDDQIENNEIYENIGISVSGTVGVVDTTVVDLSNVRCDIPASILFEENGNYALAIALMSDSELVELETLSVEYKRTGVSISGFAADMRLPGLTDNDSYALVAYFAKRVDGKTVRISDYRYLKGEEERVHSTVATRYVSRDTGGDISLGAVTSGRELVSGDVITVTDVYVYNEMPAIVPEQSGRPTFDAESMTFDLTGITIDYAATPFLQAGDGYKVVLSLDGEGESIELAELKGVIADGALTAAFDKINLKCAGASVDKEYKIVLSLYKAVGNSFDCLSRYDVLPEEREAESFAATDTIVAEGIEFRVSFAGTVECGADGIKVVYTTVDYTEVGAAE